MKKLIILPALAFALFVSGCGNDDNGDRNSRFGNFNRGERATSVETAVVERGPIALQVRSYGNVKSQDEVSVIPQVSNRISRIYADLGDTVQQGELLAKIYDGTIREQIEQARAQIRQSESTFERDSAQYERQKLLFERDLISATEFETAEAAYFNSRSQLESAKAALDQNLENLKNTEVRSPVRGVIVNRLQEEGDLATTGQALFEIASLVGYENRVFLPVEDWRQIKIGQEVQLRISSEEQASARGVVSRKSPQLDSTTGLGEVVITLTDVGTSIYPGVLTETVITIDSKPNAITVPRSALVEKVETIIQPESNTIELQRSYSVFVAKGDSVAERRELELGIEQGERIEVLSGLAAGEQIVVTGQQSLEDGAPIRVATGANFQSPQEIPIDNTSAQNDQNSSVNQQNNDIRAGSPLANMSEEERQKAREQMRGMSREERREFIQKLRQQKADSSITNQ